MRAVLGSLLAAGLVAGSVTVMATGPSMVSAVEARPAGKRVQAASLLADLKVRAETPAGYSRSKFSMWTDADGDRCDTREEVLLAEATWTPTRGAGCALTGGAWRSKYDGKTFTAASRLDIDHMVPLNEAWQSGAKKWSKTTRKAFANDLKYGPSLIAVSASTNRSKGDREPHAWLPPKQSYRCTYVAQWVAVKWRWRLSVNRAEKNFLTQRLAACGSPKVVKPTRANVTLANSGGGSSGGSPSVREYENCTAMHADYPHGVGRAGASDSSSGTPVTDFYVSTALYEANAKSDRDNDGVACEA